ncbi:hypothetical protein [Streptomyces sp. WMMB 714]|uniref:hypothetical protein n=1 Tax=Streptomyces sp. WMMB 714 TaxID=1286822 RepID=UPI0005F801A5|nr:hypothetical protein [Streptomyces sp. WMMB 714]
MLRPAPSLCLLALALASVRNPDAFAEVSVLSMKLFADWLVLAVALATPGTGQTLAATALTARAPGR